MLHWPGWSRQTQSLQRSYTWERQSADEMMMYLASSRWQELGPRCYKEVTCRRTKHVILLHLSDAVDRGWKRHDVMPWVSHPQLPELLYLDGAGKEVLSDGFFLYVLSLWFISLSLLLSSSSLLLLNDSYYVLSLLYIYILLWLLPWWWWWLLLLLVLLLLHICILFLAVSCQLFISTQLITGQSSSRHSVPPSHVELLEITTLSGLVLPERHWVGWCNEVVVRILPAASCLMLCPRSGDLPNMASWALEAFPLKSLCFEAG